MNIASVKRALAIAAISVVTVGCTVSVSAAANAVHAAHKVPATTRVVATDQGGSHYTWRYFGGPKGGIWPAPSN